MAKKDIHKKPFRKATLTKIELIAKYSREWLPVFFTRFGREIHIYDGFAGSGYDAIGNKGLCIELLDTMFYHESNIRKCKKPIHLHFNELDAAKFQELQRNINDYWKEREIPNVTIHFTNLDFEQVQDELIKKNDNINPHLIIIDQYGTEFTSPPRLRDLLRFQYFDVVSFTASMFFTRFKTEPIAEQLYPGIQQFLANRKLHHTRIHSLLCEFLRTQLNTPRNPITIVPFTLQSEKNIYGLLLFTHNPLGADKFLRITWKLNPTNGNANFDIDHDEHFQIDLFGTKMTKLEKFEKDLETLVLNGGITTNKAAYQYCIQECHLPTHAKNVLMKLKQEGKIILSSSQPGISYNTVKSPDKIVTYTVIKRSP